MKTVYLTHDTEGFYLFSQPPVLDKYNVYIEGDYPTNNLFIEEISEDVVDILCPEFCRSPKPSVMELYISSAWDKKEKSDISVKRKVRHK